MVNVSIAMKPLKFFFDGPTDRQTDIWCYRSSLPELKNWGHTEGTVGSEHPVINFTQALKIYFALRVLFVLKLHLAALTSESNACPVPLLFTGNNVSGHYFCHYFPSSIFSPCDKTTARVIKLFQQISWFPISYVWNPFSTPLLIFTYFICTCNECCFPKKLQKIYVPVQHLENFFCNIECVSAS